MNKMSESKTMRLKATVNYEGSTKDATVEIRPHVVKNAWFATKEEEEVYEIKKYIKKHTAESGDYLGKIAKILGVSVNELKKQNKLTSDNVSIGQTFTITLEEKTEKGKKITFTPLTKASVGDDVYIIVETKDLQDETIKINVHQGKEKLIGEKDKTITVTQNDKAITEIRACVGELADHEEYINKDYLRDIAVARIILAPKEDKDVEGWTTKINAATDKKTYLYLHIEADVKEKVKYNGKNNDGSDDYEQRFRNADGEWLELKVKNPIIVLDPGHGYTSGNVGASVRKYHYKVKGIDDNPKKYAPGHEIIKKDVDIDDLPQYALDDIDKWVIGMNDKKYGKTERLLVYEVVESMYNYLLSNGFSKEKIHFIRKGIKDKNEGKTLKERITYSNEIKADYYISIHADGGKYNSTGAHAIYSEQETNLKESKKLSEDIMKYYTVIKVQSESPKKSENLGIFKSNHKAKWVTLVELGYITNPSEAKKMFDNTKKIGEELAKGLIENIETEFK